MQNLLGYEVSTAIKQTVLSGMKCYHSQAFISFSEGPGSLEERGENRSYRDCVPSYDIWEKMLPPLDSVDGS